MTDKQIIDVTKCIHFNKSDIPNGCACYWDGECNHYCYYRQLKRKEQECEELKKANDGILTTIRILAKNNLKLREILAEIKDIAEIKIECKTYEIEHDCFSGTRCKALNEYIDFIKQILQKNK